MEENSDKFSELQDRLEALLQKQALLSEEVVQLSKELNSLKTAKAKAETPVSKQAKAAPPPALTPAAPGIEAKAPVSPERRFSLFRSINNDLEDFIGTSLINKIGIIAIVFGVGIGIKYAFDRDLISPVIRVLMGYLAGGVLLFFSYRLRENYRAFSAVLLSGALAIMYFSSFAAYIFYELFPQNLAFALMVLLTFFAVVEALRFDQPVIAHIGLVGAYAVPYLIGGDPDQITFLFTYVAIVNIGILFIAFRRYWKTLYYLAFTFTWLIYFSWYLFEYKKSVYFSEALIFLTLFFGIFYLTFLAYKLIRQEQYKGADVAMLLLNSFIFYGLGYLILEDHETGQNWLGLFTLGNALLHGGVSILVYQYRKADRNLFYLVLGLGLVFATIAVPVQLDGNWVTFLWAGEGLLLFWIGRSRGARAFERLAYALFPLAFFSLIDDWSSYEEYRSEEIRPVFNIYLLTSLWVAACAGIGLWVNIQGRFHHPLAAGGLPRKLLGFGLALLFLATLYFGFLLEIGYYLNRLQGQFPDRTGLSYLEDIWMINYTLFFLAVLQVVNVFRLGSRVLGAISLFLSVALLLAFLLGSLWQFSKLNDLYFASSHSVWYLLIRYLSYLFAGGLLWAAWQNIRAFSFGESWNTFLDLLLHAVILSVISLELHCWMTAWKAADSVQAGMSILWGVYALTLIGLGIRDTRRYLRIAGMVLIGVTLIKVVFVDLADQDTPTRTLVLVTIGVLLLVISFLYNKFRKALFGED